jgi:hypothetical protein
MSGPWEKYQPAQSGPWSKYQEEQAVSPTPPVEEEAPAPPADPRDINDTRAQSLGRLALGAADMAVVGARGVAGAISSGLTGLGGILAGEDLETVANRQEDVMRTVTGSPMSEPGQKFAENAGKVMEVLTNQLRDEISLVTRGQPEIATLFETAILGAPEIITGERSRPAKRSANSLTPRLLRLLRRRPRP